MTDKLEMFDSMLTSYEYNRDSLFCVMVYEECKRRLLKNGPFVPLAGEIMDEAGIIYGTAVVCLGEYGTSPRFGWFYDDEVVKELTRIFDEHIATQNEITERERRR